MINRLSTGCGFVLVMAILAGCENAPNTPEKRDALHDNVQAGLSEMKAKDPGIQDFLDKSYGWAIFPSVGKGGFIVGGAYGKGEVYRQGRFIGFSEIQEGSVGFQAGGQEFSELIVFENEAALQKLTQGQLAFGADASAVALKAGAAASMQFKNGVAVFTNPKGGLMAGVTVNGQKFGFQARNDVNMDTKNWDTNNRSRDGM